MNSSSTTAGRVLLMPMDPAALDRYGTFVRELEPRVELFAPSSYETARELQHRLLQLVVALCCFEAQHAPQTVDALAQRLEADALGMLALLCSRPRRLSWPGIATPSRRTACPALVWREPVCATRRPPGSSAPRKPTCATRPERRTFGT